MQYLHTFPVFYSIATHVLLANTEMSVFWKLFDACAALGVGGILLFVMFKWITKRDMEKDLAIERLIAERNAASEKYENMLLTILKHNCKDKACPVAKEMKELQD
ncbi:MAG: hypothetical protein FWH27_18930 [Planctomycetaceae bacterium]|nr:hypothetical protein [Planctomycetaceae bacterium]